MRYKITVGCTTDAYAHLEIEADSESDLRTKLEKVMRDGVQDLLYSPEFGGADDYRLVSAWDEDHKEAFDMEQLAVISDSQFP